MLDISRSADFPPQATIRQASAISLQVPRTVLQPGRWYWRYSAGGNFSRIARFATNEYAHYAMGDAAQAYAGRLKRFDRHVLFLRPRAGDEAVVAIYDELESAQPSSVQWWLHALEEMRVDSGGQAAVIERGAARLKVR